MDTLETCVLCGATSDRFEPYAERGEFGVVKCKECSLIFINPRATEEETRKQYTDDVSSPIRYYGKSVHVDSPIFEKRLRAIEELVPKGRLLDVGCSVGTFMDVARARGWQVAGVELNKNACELCTEKGHKVYRGLFAPELISTFEKADFDLITLNDVIEHLPDPVASMKLVGPLLRPGGYLMINTPNIDNIVARTFQIKPMEHLFYFSTATATRTLEKAGLEVVLAKKAGRRRDFGGLQTGATIDNKAWLMVCKVLHSTGLDRLANFTLENFFTDELFVLARRP